MGAVVRDDDVAAAEPEPGALPPLARGPVLALAGAVAAVLLAVSWRYGYFGDELYFIAAGRHLSWSYADQPPLVPLLALLMNTIAPGSVVVLRLPAILVTAAGVVVAALTARELGGRRRAQLLTAGAYAVCWQLLGTGHLLATSTIDPFLWGVIGWLVVRWVRTRTDWLLLVAGLVTAVDLEVKYLIPFFWVSLLISVLVVGPRALLRRPLLWVGLAIAVASTVPAVIWQAGHGWPQFGVAAEINDEVAADGGRLGFLPLALLLSGVLAGAVLLCYGLWRLLRSAELRPYRFLGWTAIGVALLCVLTEGRDYYAVGLYSLCWAAGAVEIERRRPAAWWRWAVSLPSYVVAALIAIPVVLPILPLTALNTDPLVNGGSVGWPAFVDTIAADYHALPPAQRSHTALVTSSYWQASAIDMFGPSRGLPAAYSPNRGFWYFGRPPAADTDVLFIGVGGSVPLLDKYFGSVHQSSTIDIPNGYPGQNRDVGVWACTGLRLPWSTVWATQHND